jgi:hypothetical protein
MLLCQMPEASDALEIWRVADLYQMRPLRTICEE